MALTLNGQAVESSPAAKTLERIIHDDRFTDLHDGDTDITAQEAGRILEKICELGADELNDIASAEQLAKISDLFNQKFDRPTGFAGCRLFADRTTPESPTVLDAADAQLIASAKKAQVLFIGEIHGSKKTPEYATRMLTHLRDAGYDTLAVEVEERYQEAYDQYTSGKITFEELAARAPIAKFLRESPSDPLPAEAKKFFEEARKLGFRFICIDRHDESDGVTRDHVMAGHISDAVSAGRKVIYYVGMGHASRKPNDMNPTMQRINDMDEKTTAILLDQKGIRIYSAAVHDSTMRFMGEPMELPATDRYDQVIVVK